MSNEDHKDCTRLPVVAWRIGFPNGAGHRVYEQHQPWAYQCYGPVSYEVQDLCRLTDAKALIAELQGRLTDAKALIAELQGRIGELECEESGHNNVRRKLAELLGCADEPRWKWIVSEVMDWKEKLKSAPAERGVVLPERQSPDDEWHSVMKDRATGWNACIDEVARLNSSPVSAGDENSEEGLEEWAKGKFGIGGRYTGKLYGNTDWALARVVWSAALSRAALSAPGHGEQVREWNLSAYVLPACGKPVLAYYLNSHGKGRRIRAEYVKARTVQADDLSDPDTECVEYSEQEDAYYIRQGWYELIDNWDEYGRIAVHEGVITHWQELPAAHQQAVRAVMYESQLSRP